ncbi:aldehyde dehydrogenase family protein [Rhodococcus sp. MSC1_016]|jgi:acyl-CoA reductase-like NAD-dependent aldehyde dehydrogenase|uniref:aldehyde dehydrogenase family protein n=1 Tax=Rhodococcus sp. MSC1_016 TaxID=2909266 RepID=UPI00202E4056|nr:aldehyde dehydrogenase family protein [Rhodococcus sp. MSC1_016]
MSVNLDSPTLPSSIADGTTLYIAGRWSTATDTFERLDPSDLRRVTGIYASATPGNVDAAYAAAGGAQPAWSETTAIERSNYLRSAADLLESRVHEAALTITADMGKAIRDARAEVLRSVAILRYYAGEILQPSGETYPSADSHTMLMTVEEPLGVVCVVTPWNFPFALPAWKIAAAIGFGNAVVWKPAEPACGSAVFLTRILAEAGLPAGVVNLVTGSGRKLSAALTGNPRLAALTFTGSGAVGSRLRQAVADRNIKVQLELGGKNPSIVLADADVEDAALQIVKSAMLHTGQRCTATSRVYVDRAVAPKLQELLVKHADALVVGNPYDAATDIGPLASVEQRDTVAGYLQLARDENVQFLTRREFDSDTCYIAPTILTGVSEKSRLVREEIFGPVVTVQEVDNFDDALKAANDTDYGLSSGVFTRDIATAMTFIRRTQSGLVHINRETSSVEPHVPFGGLKSSSSMSREQGKAARTFFTTTKTAYVRWT